MESIKPNTLVEGVASVPGETGRSRKLWLTGTVTDSSVMGIIRDIVDITKEDNDKDKKLKEFTREPIELYINSPGGYVYDMLGFIDMIMLNETPINTYCIGKAMSAGFIIFLAGKERFVTKRSTLLYHEMSGGSWGFLEDIKQTVEEYERMQIMIDDFVLERTLILPEKLKEVREKKFDWHIPATDAIKLGIATKIIGGQNE